jgi:hypothetical protein
MMWITIAIVLFFTILIVISFYSSRIASFTSKSKKWPPTINKCPDYWEYKNGKCNPNTNCEKIGGKKICVNFPTGGRACKKKMKPYIKVGLGRKSDNKKQLGEDAAECGIVWDGINNSYQL